MVVSKWVILVLTCLVGFGAYYSFETPSVLHNAMFRHYNVTDKAKFELYFSLIYSLYALPNMVIPLVGGIMADKFGNKTIMLVFATFILVGSAIETFACFQKSMEMFLFGRFVFGCGAETLNVCVSIVISKWFKGQELALALAIILSLSKLATVVTDWISPLMYRAIGIEANAVCVTALCLVCYLLTILLTTLDTDEADHTHLHVRSNPNSLHSLHSLADLEQQFQAHARSQEHLDRLVVTQHTASTPSNANTAATLAPNVTTITPTNTNSTSTNSTSTHRDPEITPDKHSHIQLTTLTGQAEAPMTASETDSLLRHDAAQSAFQQPRGRSRSKSSGSGSNGLSGNSNTDSHPTGTANSANVGAGNAHADLQDDYSHYHYTDTHFDTQYDAHYSMPLHSDCGSNPHQHPDLPTPHRYPPLPTYLGFTLPVWAILFFTLVMYGTFIPFTNWSTVILLQFYFTKPNASPAYVAWSEIMAARLQSVPNFISVLLTPVFGLSVDWFGHRTTLLFCAALFLVVAHSMIYVGVLASPVFPLVMIGLAFSIFGSVIWPCIPVLVEPSMQGTAYGIMTSFQNAGQFIVPLVLQQVYTSAQSYVPCEGFFIASSVLAVMVSLCIWAMDELLNHGTLRHVDDQLAGFEMVDVNQAKPSAMYNTFGSSDMYEYYSVGGAGGTSGGSGTGSGNGSIESNHGSGYGGGGYGSTNNSTHSKNNNIGISDKIRIAVPMLPLSHIPRSSSQQQFSATSSLSSTGLGGSYELSDMQHYHNAHYNNNTNNTYGNTLNNSSSHYNNPHYSAEAPSPLLGANKFSRLRAFSLSDTRSIGKDLCSLGDNSRSRQDSNSCSSAHSMRSTRSADSNASPPGPIVLIPIPNVVRKSLEYYERANSLQFPREDPHVLRRLISDRSREMHYAAQYSSMYGSGGGSSMYSGRYGNGHGIAQTAPAYNGQIMDDYQKYRMQQIHEHNMKSQLRQQEELVLVSSPRHSPRLL